MDTQAWRVCAGAAQPGFDGVQGAESQNQESEHPCLDLFLSLAAQMSPSLPTTCDNVGIFIPLCWLRNLVFQKIQLIHYRWHSQYYLGNFIHSVKYNNLFEAKFVFLFFFHF